MSLFVEVEGEAAILVEGGVYKQVPIYTRDGYLYAKVAGGFVRLMHDGATTKPRLRLEHLTWTGDLRRDGLGRLCLPEVSGSRALASSYQQQLLGTS